MIELCGTATASRFSSEQFLLALWKLRRRAAAPRSQRSVALKTQGPHGYHSQQPLPRRRPAPPKRLRRASDLPAIQSVEDLFPPEVFFKTVAGGYLEAEEIGNVACANRQFKETSYNPRMTTGRGCVALIGQGCSPSVPEAKKWFKIAAELHGTREALIFLGEWASGGTTSLMKFFVRSRSIPADPVDPVEAETLFRATVAADDSPSRRRIFAPAGHALDVARIGLATMLLRKGGDEALIEAASLRRGPGPRQYPVEPSNAAAPPEQRGAGRERT